MKLLTLEDIIKQYYETVKDKYPLSLPELTDICKAPFWFINKQMARPDMPVIHIKYFGRFRVFQARVKEKMQHADDSLRLGYITEEQHRITKEYLSGRLKEITTDEQQTLQIDEG